MDRRIFSFLALFLCLAVIVQHVQIQRERDNWRRFTVELEAQKAHAMAPLAGVLAAGAGPVFLSGLVLGTGAYYCWTHGGKEAYLQVVQATKDGVAVTKDWVQKQIAELNGINTQGSVYDLDASDGYVTSIDPHLAQPTMYTVGALQASNVYNVFSDTAGRALSAQYSTLNAFGAYNANSAYPKTFVGTLGFYVFQDTTWSSNYGVTYVRYKRYALISSQPAPGVFDPANYPSLYTGPALLSNCHAVAQAHPDLIYYTPDVASTTPPENAEPIHEPIYIAATLPDGSTIDNKGNKYPPMPGAVWPGVLNPPTVAPDSVGEIGTPTGTAVVPQTLIQKLAELGIPEGAKITSVTPNSITWEHTNGTAVYTHAPAEVTAPLAKTVTNSTTTVISQAEAESDPGNPADIEHPALPALDTEWAWGDMMEWDWDAWIAKIPFLNALSGSSLHLTSANSVINFPLSILGFSKVVNFDFADWEWVWNTIGAVIYALAAWWALQLAILKNG